MLNTTRRFVGASSDGEGIIGEVKKACAERPSGSLSSAVSAAYNAVAAAEDKQRR